MKANTMEELFKNAQDILDENVFVPIVMNKLAEHGYTASSEEEVVELLKQACVMRDAVRTGEVVPIPGTVLEKISEDEELCKEAGEVIQADPFAFGEDFEIDFTKVSADVRDAAAVGLAAYHVSAEIEKSAGGRRWSVDRGASRRAQRRAARPKAPAKGAPAPKPKPTDAEAASTKAKGKAKGKATEPGKTFKEKATEFGKKVGDTVKKPGVAAGLSATGGMIGGYAAGRGTKKEKAAGLRDSAADLFARARARLADAGESVMEAGRGALETVKKPGVAASIGAVSGGAAGFAAGRAGE